MLLCYSKGMRVEMPWWSNNVKIRRPSRSVTLYRGRGYIASVVCRRTRFGGSGSPFGQKVENPAWEFFCCRPSTRLREV
jgi:hypothetical protein